MKAAVWLLALAVAGRMLPSSFSQAADRPNFVLMLSDDQGWSGLSVPMHPNVPASKSAVIETPNLEKLAAQGMRFSAGYAPAPVCSPTRISLQTGKSPAQLHWTKAAPAEVGQKLVEPRLIKSIAASEITIAEILHSAGYATAHYGKWHINGGGPGAHGYDEHDGDIGNEQAFKFTDPNPVDIFGMAERSAKFMEKCSKANKPFFIQLSWNALHASENAMKSTLAKYQQRMAGESEKLISTGAISDDLDKGVGSVLDAIDRLGLAKNTFVIYMSDNGAGGGSRRGALRGGKGGVWEGGLRVPMIVRGPGVAANAWCHTPVVGNDWFPTFCELAGIPPNRLPRNIEGGSLASLLTNHGRGDVKRPRDGLYFHFPHYQGEGGPQSAIQLDGLKLIRFYEDNRIALFDLTKDISERNDLAKTLPEPASRLSKQLDNYLADVSAQLPTSNQDYNPNQSTETRRDNQSQRKGGKQGGRQGGKDKGKNRAQPTSGR